jgi:signal transduction histidine kinase
MDWDTGPAAWVLVRRVRTRDLGPFGEVESLWLAGMVAFVLVGAAWLAAGPLVRRVRALDASVRAAADTTRSSPVGMAGDELDRLSHTFDEVMSALRAQTQATAEREQTLRSFVENTAHDTGLPLTVLHSQLARLREDAAAKQPVDQDRLRAALEELQYLSSLLRNLSAVAALEAGEGQRVRSEVDLNAMVERVALRHRVIAEQKNITLEYATPEEPLLVQADPTLVEQALNNLVHNAVRYGHLNGHVALVLNVHAQGFELRVLDDGVGVQPAELQHLAERSWRADAARSRVPDGKGIGLAIVRDIAAQHQWDLRFEAVEPHGLCAILSGSRGTPATATRSAVS